MKTTILFTFLIFTGIASAQLKKHTPYMDIGKDSIEIKKEQPVFYTVVSVVSDGLILKYGNELFFFAESPISKYHTIGTKIKMTCRKFGLYNLPNGNVIPKLERI